MREELAERLLGKIMEWDTPTAKEELGKVRYLAAVKYDGYHNFEPGRRFIESLILWLQQFNSIDERKAAYDFIMKRMVYISETQMDHLVDLLYPQKIAPIIIKQAGEINQIPSFKRKKISTSEIFKVIRRKTLFLGLSDGARIDALRRKSELNNEQVSVSYELSPEKWQRMHENLEKWLHENHNCSEAKFENIFLIDDFSGSGNSILRVKDDTFKGKLPQFAKDALGDHDNLKTLGQYCVSGGPKLYIITYLSTKKAICSLKEAINTFLEMNKNINIASCELLEPLQLLDNSIVVPQAGMQIDQKFDELLLNYYDDRLEDEHTKTGGTDVRLGYAGCALPLVLCHNCPNNSVYLLWGQIEKVDSRRGVRALFPRISRHLEGR